MTAISNYLRLRSRAELDKALASNDPVRIIEGLRAAKRIAVRAMREENNGRKEREK